MDPLSIELEPGTKPFRQRTRPLTLVQVETLKQQLADWTADGIIAPSAGAWASLLVLVMKKDGTVGWAILRMPCGLRNAGVAYCRLVQAVVDETNDPRLSAYLDDMILHTDDPDAHVDLLDRTLAAYYQSGIKLKAKKTILFKAAVDYLGFKAPEGPMTGQSGVPRDTDPGDQ